MINVSHLARPGSLFRIRVWMDHGSSASANLPESLLQARYYTVTAIVLHQLAYRLAYALLKKTVDVVPVLLAAPLSRLVDVILTTKSALSIIILQI